MKSAFERQSVVVSSEVLFAGLVNRDNRTSKALHVVSAVEPMIQFRGQLQKAIEIRA